MKKPDLKKVLREFVSYAVTAEKENTEEWLDGLAENANEAAQAIGESGRFIRQKVRPAIVWRENENS